MTDANRPGKGAQALAAVVTALVTALLVLVPLALVVWVARALCGMLGLA